MKRFLILLLSALACVSEALCQTEFVKPWQDTGRPVIIDVYMHNDYTIKNLKKDKRIKAIIHKMSEEDIASFKTRQSEAYANNLLFGSYWLPKYDSNGAAQADAYLNMIGDTAAKNEFIALDFERHKATKQFISPYNSYLFVSRIFERTGRYPHIYCGLDNLNKLMQSAYKETFKKCKLWMIALMPDGDVSKTFKNKGMIWQTYSLWQFSCEINCCKGAKKPCYYHVAGIDCYMDYDIYNGTYDDLLKNWGK